MATKFKEGSLAIVGSGIKLVGHVTLEAKALIEQADKLLYVVNETLIANWLHNLNDSAESLHTLYEPGKLRQATYDEMVAAILGYVRQGVNVCVAFYGHPGVFVNPGWRAIHQAQEEGYLAYMLPGISAEDCLFVDLELDPARNGCQSYEATNFLIFRRHFDTAVPLILWQVGVVGQTSVPGEEPARPGLSILTEYLSDYYPPHHLVALYEAPIYPVFEPKILWVPLQELPQAAFTPIATLYVPPLAEATLDEEMMTRLGLSK